MVLDLLCRELRGEKAKKIEVSSESQEEPRNPKRGEMVLDLLCRECQEEPIKRRDSS